MRSFSSLRKIFLALVLSAIPATSFAGIFVSVAIAPPPLPVYSQPVCPGYGFMWTPGYWGYGPAGYYWIPGVWVHPPRVGVLWTPGYWGWGGGLYAWHPGYWGPHVGFYGGINYGFGYGGVGFGGGYWRGGNFFYNRAVMNVDDRFVHNTYISNVRTTVVNNRVSYNGGEGGMRAMPTRVEMQASREQHFQPTSSQMAREQMASADRGQLYSANHGQPAVLAKNRVNGRSYDQQGRIAQGIRSGQMTPGEAARAENRQQNIDRSVRQDRRANGGRLTPQQRRNINRRQNYASRQIYRQKHNGNRGPGY